MNKMNKLFGRLSAYCDAPELNYEGAPAFVRCLEERALQVLMTGFFEDAFYADAKELAAEAVATLEELGAKDPELLARAVVYARENGCMRVAPVTGLLVLSKHDPKLFKTAFSRVVKTLGDLSDFVTLARSKAVRSMGRAVREACANWLREMPAYQLIKYGAAGDAKGPNAAVNVRDILRLVHPKPGDAGALFAYAIKRVKGEKVDEGLLSRLPGELKAFERFKKADEEEALELVLKYRLPYEVVTSKFATAAAWKALAKTAPFMNMLRNLNNYEKHGVFKDPELKRRVVERLTDPEELSKSKLFPFRFFAAYKAFTGDAEVREALAAAVELSLSALPDLGRVLVAVDESGSMDVPVSQRSTVKLYEVGNLFAAAFWKKSREGWLAPFNTEVLPVSVNRGDSVATVANSLFVGGGTDLSKPLEWALDGKKQFDTAVFITDNVSWADHLRSNRGVVDAIRRYRGRNKKARFVFVQLAPYQKVQAPQSEPGVSFVYGWSDDVLRFVARDTAAQLESVRAVTL